MQELGHSFLTLKLDCIMHIVPYLNFVKLFKSFCALDSLAHWVELWPADQGILSVILLTQHSCRLFPGTGPG